MASTQQALVLQEVGKPLQLIDDHPVPYPGPGEVQIKVSVASLLQSDQYSRDWGFLVSDALPAILAKDVVGTVSSLGEGVTEMQLGDRVISRAHFGSPYTQCGLQQYALGCAELMVKVPGRVSDDEAATLPTNLTSIVASLSLILGISAPWSSPDSGETPKAFLIVGGGSACGQFATEIARLSKIPTIIVVGGDEANLKTRGATHVIDRHVGEEAIVQRIRSIVGDELVYAIDTANANEGLSLALTALSSSERGKLARLVPLGELDKELKRGHEVLDVKGNEYVQHPIMKAFWALLPKYLDNGDITATAYAVGQPLGLHASVVDATLDAYRDGKKVVKMNVHV